MLPRSHVDFVSLSSYDFQNYHLWPRPRTAETIRERTFAVLDYVEQHLPPRDIPGKRVFIGEIGHTWEQIARQDDISIEAAALQQARAALIQAKVNLEWGVPIWLWWSTFSSREGTFGLMDNHTNKPSPLMRQLFEYYQWARTFTENHQNVHGILPHPDTFRRAAVEQLGKQIQKL